MIALPMHPSYAYPIRELKANAQEILAAAQEQANKQAGRQGDDGLGEQGAARRPYLCGAGRGGRLFRRYL